MEISNFQGVFPDGEWDFCRMFSGDGHHPDEFSGQFGSFPGGNDGGLQFSATQLAFDQIDPEFTNVNESFFNSLNPDFPFVSRENSSSSNSSSSVLAPNYDQSCFLSDCMPMDFFTVDQKSSSLFFPPGISMTDNVFVTENANHLDDHSSLSPKELQLKRKLDFPESEADPPGNAAKKKTKISKDAMKGKKNEKATRNSILKNKKEESESASNSSSEEDNASNEALNSSGKPRASRGSATDPQSLYARKRRERINERLRILQNLVPNGTKVDISTMLEEAVQYVKFLQLQIKLLSSDDLWMYAPIAYNGMDIGLNQKLSLLL